MNKEHTNNIVIYEDKKGNIELRADIEKDTIWATQEQISKLFECERSVITKHLRNIFKDQELQENSVCAKLAHTATDGKRYKVQCYNLDAIIAVGYRVNSKKATQFRIWATGILKRYLVEGHVLNKRRLEEAPQKLLGLYETIALLESKALGGKLRGKLTLKLTEELEPLEK